MRSHAGLRRRLGDLELSPEVRPMGLPLVPEEVCEHSDIRLSEFRKDILQTELYSKSSPNDFKVVSAPYYSVNAFCVPLDWDTQPIVFVNYGIPDFALKAYQVLLLSIPTQLWGNVAPVMGIDGWEIVASHRWKKQMANICVAYANHRTLVNAPYENEGKRLNFEFTVESGLSNIFSGSGLIGASGNTDISRAVLLYPAQERLMGSLITCMEVFIVAHELGHLALNHEILQSAAASQTLRLEKEADEYALELSLQICQVKGISPSILIASVVSFFKLMIFLEECHFARISGVPDRNTPQAISKLSALRERVGSLEKLGEANVSSLTEILCNSIPRSNFSDTIFDIIARFYKLDPVIRPEMTRAEVDATINEVLNNK